MTTKANDVWAEIAVPIPIPHGLTYSIPEAWVPLAKVGVRVRVSVGRRKVVGVLTALQDQPPDRTVRPIEAIVDQAPVIQVDLLALGAFIARYYMAPLGEVFRAMLPSEKRFWSDRRVSITDRGALSLAEGEEGIEILQRLLHEGPQTMGKLQAHLRGEDLDAKVSTLHRSGKVQVTRESRSHRYRKAVDLSPMSSEKRQELCGRSAKALAVVTLLENLGRPASVEELCQQAQCGTGVVNRLLKLGVLRSFTEIVRLDLGRYRLGAEKEKPAITLRDDQHRAVEAILTAYREGQYAAFLLQGMTGSGKTEVYLRAADEVVARGGSVILLVPEIALVPALAETVRQRFGNSVALLHSALTPSERRQEWSRIREGQANVVLGPRSALFAPVSGLQLIVVDEEQDSSYKQDSTPRYHGRDLAMVRARNCGGVVVLTSATPSMESRHNTHIQKVRPLALTERVGQGSLPEGILVDLREEDEPRKRGEVFFSSRLLKELRETLDRGDQAILLRNRRGYSPRYLCRACGEDFRCEDCGLPRTFHRRLGLLVCHYCGSKRVKPKVCSACGEAGLEPIGAGTERVEERFRDLFPEVSLVVLDQDSSRKAGGSAAILNEFGSGTAQVLIGTQMVSKGHHFPRVSLAAVLSADTYLGFPDFRAVEKTYNLLVQLAGRAGRGEIPGKVVVQTYYPHHYAIQAALGYRDEDFAREELRFRKVFHYPPFGRVIQVVSFDRNRSQAEARLMAIAHRLEEARPPGVRLSGPAPAPLERLRGQWRFQLLIRGSNSAELRTLMKKATKGERPKGLIVDVDPQDLL